MKATTAGEPVKPDFNLNTKTLIIVAAVVHPGLECS
jgi:hypothetical protein